jgi:hypothetical protein
MNPLFHLHKDKIDSLGYDSIYLEKPIPNIAQDIDWKNILENPPANISKTTFQELQLLSRLTKNRTEDQTQLALNIDKDMDTPFELLCQSYGVNYPKSLIDEFYDIVRPILLNTKAYYNRPRPNQLAPYFGSKIDVIVTNTHHTASYPSGHTVYASTVSRIIQKTSPSIPKQKLNNLVDQTALARILQGVHYPSDNAASIKFTNVLFKHLYPKLI